MITQIDFCILNAIQAARTPFWDFIMPCITYLGSGGAVWIIISVIMLFFKKTRKTGITIALALIIGLFLSTLGFKNLIMRERPFNTEGALLNINSLLIGAPSGRFSFPSGHSVSSFSAAAVLMMYSKKIGIPALILASLIAFSRLYLYVHVPSDVLAGALVGIIFAIISNITVNSIRRKVYERKLSNNTE